MAADTSWTLDPGPILLIAAATAVYLPRWRRVRRAEGPRAAGAWRLASFAGAMVALVAALISPIDRLGEQAFTFHMVQHVLLLDLAPILLVCSLTKVILRPVTRRVQRLERAAGPFGHPIFAVVLYVAVMWVWHVPSLYDAALEHSTIHVLEHVCFMTAGLLYWWHLLSPLRSRVRQGVMAPVMYMLSTKLAVGLLGIGITFAPDALYAFYEHQEPIWGLDASTDQAVAGAIMALEQSIIMGIALAWLFVRALEESEREEQRQERFGAA
jgi:putative membrane protein